MSMSSALKTFRTKFEVGTTGSFHARDKRAENPKTENCFIYIKAGLSRRTGWIGA